MPVRDAGWYESDYQKQIRERLKYAVRLHNLNAIDKELGVRIGSLWKHIEGMRMLGYKRQIELYKLIGIDLPVYDTKGIYRKQRKKLKK